MKTRNSVSSVKSAIWPLASRRSAQCAYASINSRMARRSVASAKVIVGATSYPFAKLRLDRDRYANELLMALPSPLRLQPGCFKRNDLGQGCSYLYATAETSTGPIEQAALASRTTDAACMEVSGAIGSRARVASWPGFGQRHA